MSSADKWFFGFITIWIILGAGGTDILDGITSLLIDNKCEVEVK